MCHLETTSFPLPNAIQRFERGAFSYQPGEPLAGFILNFDHAPGTGREDKFEIVNAAYRLRRSACFLKSNGKMLCTTCHNPHDIPRGEAADRHYTAVCRQCHAEAFDRLVAGGKPHAREQLRRLPHAETAHRRRNPRGGDRSFHPAAKARRRSAGRAGRNARTPIAAAWSCTIRKRCRTRPKTILTVAVAQVIQQSNLTEGIAQLTAAIEKYQPAARGILSGTRRRASEQRATGQGSPGLPRGGAPQSEFRGRAAETRDGAAALRAVRGSGRRPEASRRACARRWR